MSPGFQWCGLAYGAASAWGFAGMLFAQAPAPAVPLPVVGDVPVYTAYGLLAMVLSAVGMFLWMFLPKLLDAFLTALREQRTHDAEQRKLDREANAEIQAEQRRSHTETLSLIREGNRS